METIENEFLCVTVDLHGGTLSSVFDKITGRQLLWQGAEDSWKSRDVVIFPVTARFKNKAYSHDGVTYPMKNHGLIRYGDLSVEEKTERTLTLRFSSDSETLKSYPFEFDIYVMYVLCGRSLSISMKIENKGRKTMYFGAGFHPAYNIDCNRGGDYDDISGNVIEFSSPQHLTRYILDESGTLIVGKSSIEIKELPLSKPYFDEVKTLIVGGVRGNIALRMRGGDTIVYDMKGAPYTAIWSYEKHGGFVCIEPWWGLPDFADCDSEISRKEGMNALECGKTFECGYKVVYNIGGDNK